MVVELGFMAGMVVLVGAVPAAVFMIVRMTSDSVRVLMKMFVDMFAGMGVSMLVNMLLASMGVPMSVNMPVLMRV